MPKTSHVILRILDVSSYFVIAAFSVDAAFQLRFEFSPPPAVAPMLWRGLLLAILIKPGLFFCGRFHRSLRMHAEARDLGRLLMWNVLASFLFAVAARLWMGPAYPRSVYLIDFLVCFLCCILARFWLLFLPTWGRPRVPASGILIYGAGAAGATMLQEIRRNPSLNYYVAGFLDDDESKRGADIAGTQVLGTGREAAALVARLNRARQQVDEIVIAMPSATGRQKCQALANCQAAGVRCKTVPGLADLLERQALLPQVRHVELADLLGRPQVELDDRPMRETVAGRSVLITGAAGSIGSELCRQVARMQPARLIALDKAESDLFRIECELRDRHPRLEVVAALADIRDTRRLAEVFERHAIDSVFHAAAYKHVPMLESHILEAVENNIVGTWNLVHAVRRRRVPRFLMISSDKAVNPTSVMGATKRACELIVAGAPRVRGETTCVSVRFGNVLGSNGSVVPVFQSQIAAGGPVRVTHPEVQRYFMTIPEAVSLVLQASSMGTDSEIFVLDMGEPIRIVDLAVNMIRLAGLKPYEDIDIQFTGLRPGEKLFEEINCAQEHLLPTYHDKIRIFQQPQPDWTAIVAWFDYLRFLIAKRARDPIVSHIRELVPEYQPAAFGGAVPATRVMVPTSQPTAIVVNA
ncbi:MAG TPA: nucleoside-diphosphate sugar epimerase/dehydratase [Bryobacteraceae bacterium]|nr:nucleoside-diphosphate sugar epimerase/dehydratase [Bryobacteraceae bacterium]